MLGIKNFHDQTFILRSGCFLTYSSAWYTINLVRSTMSGLTDTLVAPHFTNNLVNSGYKDGACPQIEQVTVRFLQVVTIISKAFSTPGSNTSYISATFSLSRSTPSISIVKSLDPID